MSYDNSLWPKRRPREPRDYLKGSIVFRELLTITTIWGICSSFDSQPKRPRRCRSDTVLSVAKRITTRRNSSALGACESCQQIEFCVHRLLLRFQSPKADGKIPPAPAGRIARYSSGRGLAMIARCPWPSSIQVLQGCDRKSYGLDFPLVAIFEHHCARAMEADAREGTLIRFNQ
jgi:hypothetical protein